MEELGNIKTLVLCDFDGTVTTNDMGYNVIRRFARDGWEEINRAYCAGEIGSQDAYRKTASLFRVTKDEILSYIFDLDCVDPHFADFYQYCKKEGFAVKIVSDGLDFYIEAILGKYGLEEIEFYSNKVVFHDDRTLSIMFPWHNETCDRCGNCKKSILERFSDDYDRVVYVGDGYSDVCPSGYADVVFAKSILYEKCVESGMRCIHYENFGDVKNTLKKYG